MITQMSGIEYCKTVQFESTIAIRYNTDNAVYCDTNE